MKISRFLAILFLLFIFCLGHEKQSLASSFQGLGDLARAGFSSEAFDVSGDGLTVVGRSSSSRNGREAFIWSQENGMKGLGQIKGSSFFSQSIKISKNGLKVIGDASSLNDYKNSYECFIWD